MAIENRDTTYEANLGYLSGEAGKEFDAPAAARTCLQEPGPTVAAGSRSLDKLVSKFGKMFDSHVRSGSIPTRAAGGRVASGNTTRVDGHQLGLNKLGLFNLLAMAGSAGRSTQQ